MRYQRRTARRTVGVVLVVAAMVSAAGVGLAAPTGATVAGTNGRLVFARQGQLFTMDPDGTNVVRLTTTGRDFSPVWSPDGRSIAFVRSTDTGGAIWTMRADGTGASRVSDVTLGCAQPPLWSPDGTAIAYWEPVQTAGSDTMRGAIWVIAADGTTRTRLTTYDHYNAVGGWSPDGSTLVYQSDRDGDTDIWTMRADGSAKTKLTQNTLLDLGSMFSPDGSRIVFYRASKSRRSTSIWTMNADGSGARQLTSTRTFDMLPTWSPDGKWIAFRRDSTSAAAGTLVQLFRIAPDGTRLRRLTGPDTLALDFTWSPDSSRLAFIDDYVAIDIVGADGTGLTTILERTTPVGVPDWQAVP